MSPSSGSPSKRRIYTLDRAFRGGPIVASSFSIGSTSGSAAVPSIPGLAEVGYLTNETVFDLTILPARLAVIGAGPLGCELAQAFARFGAAVTLLDRGSQVLGREDADAAACVHEALARDGVRLALGGADGTIALPASLPDPQEVQALTEAVEAVLGEFQFD